jgi:hypothetical protein
VNFSWFEEKTVKNLREFGHLAYPKCISTVEIASLDSFELSHALINAPRDAPMGYLCNTTFQWEYIYIYIKSRLEEN